MKNSKILLVIIALAIPLLCIVVVVAGALGFGVVSTFASPQASEAELEAEILAISADYVSDNDLDAALTRLETLELANERQYISFMLDRYIQEGRGHEDVDAANLLILADALGATTPSMIAALSTPTPIPTPTLPPTSTPLPADTPVPTDTPTEVPTEVPTEAPTEVPTDTPEPTATLGPPTNTPEPTATPEPTNPPVDFVITEQRILTIEENGGCLGKHQIFVTVLDAAGTPLDNVTVEDTFRAVPPHLSGEKGPGKLEYDLWKNGFSLEVTKKEDGSPATSQVTQKLSSVDEDIPDEWLLQAHYCSDPADCAVRKGSNQLCRGHYSYYVTFQKAY